MAKRKTKKERGQEVWDSNEYLKSIIAQIPEDKRDAVLEHLGEHALRQDEFSSLADEAAAKAKEAADAKAAAEKALNENIAWRDHTNKWLTEKQAELAARESALSTPNGSLDPTKFVTKEEIAKLTTQARSEAQQEALNFGAAVDAIRERHFKKFGEYLPQGDLIAHAQKIGKTIDVAYEDMMAPRFAELAEKQQEQWKKDTREQIEREVRSSLGPGIVYPVNNEPTTLAGITPAQPNPNQAPQFGKQAAIAAMLRGDVKPQA